MSHARFWPLCPSSESTQGEQDWLLELPCPTQFGPHRATNLQKQCVALRLRGLTNDEIAKELSCSESTVRGQYVKLNQLGGFSHIDRLLGSWWEEQDQDPDLQSYWSEQSKAILRAGEGAFIENNLLPIHAQIYRLDLDDEQWLTNMGKLLTSFTIFNDSMHSWGVVAHFYQMDRLVDSIRESHWFARMQATTGQFLVDAMAKFPLEMVRHIYDPKHGTGCWLASERFASGSHIANLEPSQFRHGAQAGELAKIRNMYGLFCPISANYGCFFGVNRQSSHAVNAKSIQSARSVARLIATGLARRIRLRSRYFASSEPQLGPAPRRLLIDRLAKWTDNKNPGKPIEQGTASATELARRWLKGQLEIVDDWQETALGSRWLLLSPRDESQPTSARLRPREWRCLNLIAQGLRPQEIRRLGESNYTKTASYLASKLQQRNRSRQTLVELGYWWTHLVRGNRHA